MIYYFIFLFLVNLFIYLNHSKFSKFYNIFDRPDFFRKLHKNPVSLLGGPIIILNFVFYIFFLYVSNIFLLLDITFSNKTLFVFIFLFFTFFVIGYIDDKSDVSANKKFLTTIILVYLSILIDKNILIAELNFTFLSKTIYLENFSIIFTTICIMLFINAFNMFDGINGQAAGYFIILLGVLYFKGFDKIIILTFAIPILFFLFFNFLGKMFLGNTGSLLLSIIISLFFILLYSEKKIFSDEIVLFLLFPGLDMFRLFLERLLKGRSPFLPDKEHLHHYLIEKLSLTLTLFLTVGVQAVIFFTYLITELASIYFIIFLVFYYLSLYFYFRKNSYAKKNNI